MITAPQYLTVALSSFQEILGPPGSAKIEMKVIPCNDLPDHPEHFRFQAIILRRTKPAEEQSSPVDGVVHTHVVSEPYHVRDKIAENNAFLRTLGVAVQTHLNLTLQ